MKKLISVVLALALVLSMGVSAFAAGKYVVAGTAGLCGSDWNPGDSKNTMTLVDGLYTITYTNVAVGTYEFKVTDGSWNNSWGADGGSGNYKFAVTQVGDITITFNADTKEINVSGSGVGEAKMDIQYVAAVGAGAGNFLNNVNWDPANESNRMGLEYTGYYRIEYYDVAAGEYEFKFAANGQWVDDWGTGDYVQNGVECDIAYKGGNSKLKVEKDGSTVSILLDMSGMDSKGNGAKLTVWVTSYDEEDDSADIKFQTKGDSLRLVTWVDSLDYQEVVFNVTVDGETAAIPCTTVYSAINAGDAKLESAAEIFNENALYFVTYTIESIPEGVTEFDVSVTWTDLEGNSNTSDVRTVTL